MRAPEPDLPEDCECCPERCKCGDCERCEWEPPVPPTPGPGRPKPRRPGPFKPETKGDKP